MQQTKPEYIVTGGYREKHKVVDCALGLALCKPIFTVCEFKEKSVVQSEDMYRTAAPKRAAGQGGGNSSSVNGLV